MSLRGRHGSPSLQSRQCLVTVRGGTHFALPAEIVRGLGTPEGDRRDHDVAQSHVGPEVPHSDLIAHFPGATASGVPGRLVLCGREAVQEAVLVDEVLGLMEVPYDQIRSLPAQFTGSERLWFSGLFLFQDTVALLVDLEWLLVQSAHVLPRQPQLSAPGDPAPPAAADALQDLALEEATDADDTPWAEL